MPRFLLQWSGDIRRLCHCDDLCVVARQKQLQTFGKIFEKLFEVNHTGHIGFGVDDEKELIEQSKLML